MDADQSGTVELDEMIALADGETEVRAPSRPSPRPAAHLLDAVPPCRKRNTRTFQWVATRIARRPPVVAFFLSGLTGAARLDLVAGRRLR